MKGHFCSHRGTTVFIFLFMIVIIGRIDGYPFPWPDFLSYEEKTQLNKESSHDIGVASSIAEVFRDPAKVASESEGIRYLGPLSTFGDSRRVSRIVETAQQERVVTFGDEDTDKEKDEEDTNKDKDHEDEDHDVTDDVEIDYDKRNNGNSMTNIEPNLTRDADNGTENADDEIMQVIDEAIEDNIFLSPEELELELARRNGARNEATTYPKKHKTRSPGNPDNIDTQTNCNTNDDKIVFSDQIPITNLDDFTCMPVPSCEGTTICENVPYYPSDEFVENAMRMNYIEPINDPSTLSQRIGPLDTDENQDDSLCLTETKTVLPQSGQDENDQWHYILNNEKYVQKVNFERCQNEGQPCKVIETASGYKTLCKQKYIYQQLVSLVPNGTVALKPIKIPSSCCCHFKFDGDVRSRMGVALNKKNHRSPLLTGYDN